MEWYVSKMMNLTEFLFLQIKSLTSSLSVVYKIG